MQTEQDLCELQLPSGHKLLVLSPLETSMNEEVDEFVQEQKHSLWTCGSSLYK